MRPGDAGAGQRAPPHSCPFAIKRPRWCGATVRSRSKRENLCDLPQGYNQEARLMCCQCFLAPPLHRHEQEYLILLLVCLAGGGAAHALQLMWAGGVGPVARKLVSYTVYQPTTAVYGRDQP